MSSQCAEIIKMLTWFYFSLQKNWKNKTFTHDKDKMAHLPMMKIRWPPPLSYLYHALYLQRQSLYWKDVPDSEALFCFGLYIGWHFIRSYLTYMHKTAEMLFRYGLGVRITSDGGIPPTPLPCKYGHDTTEAHFANNFSLKIKFDGNMILL